MTDIEVLLAEVEGLSQEEVQDALSGTESPGKE
jgi:hypothetical protein